MVAALEDWGWSSYHATAGLEVARPFFATDWLLRVFSDQRDAAVTASRRFVAEGIAAASPWLELKNQVYLGSEQFVERVQKTIDPDRSLKEVPRRQRRPIAKPLSAFSSRYADRDCADRDRAMTAAYRTGAYSMQAIADQFGVGRMTVSRAVKREEGGDCPAGTSDA